MKSHGQSRYHVINAMRVENFVLYKKYRCDTRSVLVSMLSDILYFEASQGKQTVLMASKETYPLLRKNVIAGIKEKIAINEPIKIANNDHMKIANNETTKIAGKEPIKIASNEHMQITSYEPTKTVATNEDSQYLKIASIYYNNVQSISNLQKGRLQNNIVLVTDERDNFENTLSGFDGRITVLKVPGLTLKNAFDNISSHPSFGKGTLFIFSCGIHDCLQSFVLPSCINFNCVNPQIMLSFPPSCNSTHILILSALQLNISILQATSNDIALFVGLIPVNVNQYNDYSLKTRQCYSYHTAIKVPTVGEHLYREFNDTISLYNYYTKYHAQTLGYDTWDLEAAYFKRSVTILQTNGYNILSSEEVLRVKEAKRLSRKLIASLSSEIEISKNKKAMCKIFVRPLSPADSTKTTLQNYFARFGTVVKIFLKKMATGNKSMAFVEFSQPSSVDKVMTSKSHLIDGMLTLVSRFVKPSSSKSINSGNKVNLNQSIVRNGVPPVLLQTTQNRVPQDSSLQKYPVNLIFDVKLHYEQTMVEIMQLQKNRYQTNIVIISDERDNFDMTLAAFDPRVTILKIAALKFESIFAIVEKHPFYGKGTIFIFSCGIHDLLLSFYLQDCLTFHCSTPQTILAILPANYDNHYLIKKVIQLNKDLLLATENDIALFCGITPVHVDQYNVFTLNNRPCGLTHFSNPVCLLDMTHLNFLYKHTIIWYNNFTRFHAQKLCYQPWDLELSYYTNSSVSVLLPNGYNVFPEEDIKKANQAKILLTGLLKTLSTIQIPISFLPMVHNVETHANIATQNGTNLNYSSTSHIPSNLQVDLNPSSCSAVVGYHYLSTDNKRSSRGIEYAGNISNGQTGSKFFKVFFVGQRDLVNPLLKCDIYSSIICHNFRSYLWEETESLLKKLEFIPERSLCCLVFDLSVIAKPLISPECSKTCKQPLSIFSLKVRTCRELYDLIFSRLQLIANCIGRLALHLPVILIPLNPSRLFCQDEALQNHEISHTISMLGVNVVSGSLLLWSEAFRVLSRSWATLIEITNGKYDPANYISNYDFSSSKSFYLVKDFADVIPHWSEQGNWREFINRYISSLTYQFHNGNCDASSDFHLTTSMVMPRSVSRRRSISLFYSRRSLSSVSNDSIRFYNKRSPRYRKYKRSLSKSTSCSKEHYRNRKRRSRSSERKSQGQRNAFDQHGMKSSSLSSGARKQRVTEERNASPLPECNAMSIQALEVELSKRIGYNLFEEYTLKLDVMRLSFEEEFEVFKSVPELHPNYDKYYETFSIHHHKQYGSSDRQYKETKWKIFWKSNFDAIKTDDWQRKQLNLIKEYQAKGAKKSLSLRSDEIRRQDFAFEDALTLIDNLCESITFLGPAITSMISVCRDLGTNTKAAYEVFTESGNVILINLIKEKFKSLSQSTTSDRRYSYQMAVDWIPRLLDEAKRGPPISHYEFNNISSVIDLNAIAKLSKDKGTEFALKLIKMALVYEGVEKPSQKLVNEVFLKVCKIHFSMAMN